MRYRAGRCGARRLAWAGLTLAGLAGVLACDRAVMGLFGPSERHVRGRECERCQGRGRIECLGCEGNGVNPLLAGHGDEEAAPLIPVDCPRCKGAAAEPCLICFGGSPPEGR